MLRPLAQRYLPSKCLGSGRVSTVYEATDLSDNSKVIVKIFRPEFIKGASSHDHLYAELKKRFSVKHPNITAIRDIYSLEMPQNTRTIALITEHVVGETLAERMLDFVVRPLNFGEILSILNQIALGIDYLHQRNIPLKDLSPKRITIDTEAKVKLPAFGFISSTDWCRNNSQILQVSDVDYRYLAPELFVMPNLGEATCKSDIYMFGLLAFELGCGTTPFDANRATLMQLHRTEPLPRLLVDSGLPDWFNELVMRCTEKQPENRIAIGDLRSTFAARLKDSSTDFSVVPRYPDQSGLHVLFVEDNKLDQLSLARAAKKERFPFSYEMVRSFNRAKETLSRKQFDVVVSDFMLPDGTALDVMKLTGNTPVIVITGAGREDIAREALRAGAFDYVSKNTRNSHLALIPELVLRAAKRNAGKEVTTPIQSEISECIDSTLQKLRLSRVAHGEQMLRESLDDIESTILRLKELMLSNPPSEDSSPRNPKKQILRSTESLDFYNGLSISE